MKNKLHKFPYSWTLKDAVFTKDKGTVFSCFSCGGGSTMGYKLAGFDVIGCNEIDNRMMEIYQTNHHPKYAFLDGIQTFKDRKDLPKELFNLDILDGSPPCSSFSMSGNRDKDWGKKKQFAEGQTKQVLDTLFFDFIELGKLLQPKIIIAENVKGLLMGNATKYKDKIIQALDAAGYYTYYKLLDASKMGVPQIRNRVFFCSIRKDLYRGNFADLMNSIPALNLRFNEKKIPYREIEDSADKTECIIPCHAKLWDNCKAGSSLATVDEKGHCFGASKTHPNKVISTVCASGGGHLHYKIKRKLNLSELLQVGSFPADFDFLDKQPKYIIGMSVPPVMIAQIATRIYDQWLSKI